MESAQTLRPNGAGAAAVLSAGIGSLVLGILTFAGDRSPAFKNLMIFYRPTGALSGVTTVAILVWLVSWVTLHLWWRKKDVALKPVVMSAFIVLALSLLLTFPPFMDVV